MNNGDVRGVAVAPLSKEQRQRLECMTAVRGLWGKKYQHDDGRLLDIEEILELTDYLVTGGFQ